MTSINFIKLENVKTFLSKVSEEIDNKYIKNYIYTQIQSQNLTLDNNSKIVYSYIQKINSYQISIIYTKNKNIIIEPFVFAILYLEKDKGDLDLYICDNFFALYDNAKLIYFKEIKSGFEKKDVIKYISQTFDTKIDNIYDVNENKLDEYKNRYNKNIKKISGIKYLTKQNNKRAVYYLSYLLVVSVILGLYSFNIFSQNRINIVNNIKDVKLEQVKNEYQTLLLQYKDNKKVTANLINLFNILDKNEIRLINLKVSQDRTKVMIKAEKKEVLLDFLDFYDEDSTINNMRYIKSENCYELLATVKLY